ncbi:MAG TPA: hypothetical protein VGB76_04775 [Pyrinomonadaceae bacterium]|jgi:hypothetical protein
MKKKTLTALIVAAAMIHGTALRTTTRAQEPATPAPGGSVSINNQAGRVQIKLERGGRVAISNRFGRITIMGWDRDTVEATATSDKGAEAVQVEMTADPAAAQSVLSLNVPGRPGQRGSSFPYVYTNPNINLSPRIYTAPIPPIYPNPNSPYDPNPNPDQDGAATPNPAKAARPANAPKPSQSSKPAQVIKPAKPSNNNDSNVIIVPLPDMSDAPLPEIAEAPQAVIGTHPAQPRQPSVPAAKGGAARGIGAGAGGGFGAAKGGESSNSGISLLVRMPRYAKLEPLEVRSGDVNISDIDGPVLISSGSSNLNINRVGALEVRARAGNINVHGVEGLVYIVATSGTITVRRTKGDVRATSINGNINLHCIKGRVDASNARGGIVLGGVEGDVEASTTDADINFVGAIRPQGRYRLKSMEGRVIMSIPENSPGFTAILDSYNSDVVTTFPIITETLAGGSTRVNRRLVVKQGDGAAQITLDSFSQTVHLTKLASPATNACQ